MNKTVLAYVQQMADAAADGMDASSEDNFAWSRASSGSSSDDSSREAPPAAAVKTEQLGDSEAAAAERYLQRRVKRERRAARTPSPASSAEEELELKFSAEETVVEPKRRRQRQRSAASPPHSDTDRSSSKIKVALDKSIKNSPTKLYASKEYVSESSASSDDDTIGRPNGSVGNTAHHNGHLHEDSSDEVIEEPKGVADTPRKNRISDRIVFEENTEENISESHVETPLTECVRLQRYLASRPRVGPLKVAGAQDAVSAADELWLVQGPRDLLGSTGQAASITLDAKCKFKVDEHTYEGKLEDGGSFTLLTFRHGKSVIEHIPLQGSVRFRRKMHKPRIMDSQEANSQTGFIPLPLTKCRHPLFGSDYKKAIKLPSSVRKRLKACAEAAPTPCPAATEDATDAADEVVRAEKRKKRKRKQARDGSAAAAAAAAEEPEPEQAAKRRRRSTANAHAWESAQDIEQNLFNF